MVALDNYDGDISGLVVVGGDVLDPNTPGTYHLTYDVIDANGNSATQVTRTVVITDGYPPVLTVLGDAQIYIEYQ